MISPLTSITRAATRNRNEALNILCFPTHERYQQSLDLTGHKFYMWRGQGIKDWSSQYAKLPLNHFLLDPALGDNQIPLWLDIDAVLCQSKQGQYNVARQLSQALHVPLINSELTAPLAGWGPEVIAQYKLARGHFNVFLTDFTKGAWGYGNDDSAIVIKHGIDTAVFNNEESVRKPHLISVVNDWINRDSLCGFSSWRRITNGMPVRVWGDTPGLSAPAPSIEALAKEYRESLVFVNTSTHSSIPTALLEAMSCGCAVVSTATCEIPAVIKNGFNGYCSNDENQLKQWCEYLLKHPDEAKRIGQNARKTIENDYSLEKFVLRWDSVFDSIRDFVYTGEF
jgi:hypothetical protein